MKDDKVITEQHPAFGQIAISRSTHGGGVDRGAHLYGSDFVHMRSIGITISRSERRRELAHDWHYPKSPALIEIMMSESQWATFVSSVGQGEGVPCTIERVDGVRQPTLERPKDRADQFGGEIEDRLALVKDSLDELTTAVASSGLSGVKQKAMAGLIATAQQNLDRNLAYVRQCFDRHVETTVERAKAEINAYTAQAMARAGLAEGERPIALPAKLEGGGE